MKARALVAWNVRRIRVDRGIPQEQLAYDAGIDRSYMSGLERQSENPTIDLWFDKTAFVVPASFTFGDSGPGILRSDHQWNVDMSLFKRFEIRSGQTLEFRAEGFNVFNSTYFSAPNTNVDTAAGGRVTSTSNTARQIQFGFKYLF